MKKILFLLGAIFMMASHIHGGSLEPSSYTDYWKISKVEDKILFMGNIAWRVLPNQGELVEGFLETTGRRVFEKFTFGKEALTAFHIGDRVIIEGVFDDTVVLFVDLDSLALLCCSLESFLEEDLPHVEKIETNGFVIELTSGTKWVVSWDGSFSSRHWRVGDCVVPIRQIGDSRTEHVGAFGLINLYCLRSGNEEGFSFQVTPLLWR